MQTTHCIKIKEEKEGHVLGEQADVADTQLSCKWPEFSEATDTGLSALHREGHVTGQVCPSAAE